MKVKTFWHDQVSDLELLRAQRCSAAPAQPARSVRYRHPVTGAAWHGEGRQPQWLCHALLSEGWLLIDLRLAAQQPGATLS